MKTFNEFINESKSIKIGDYFKQNNGSDMTTYGVAINKFKNGSEKVVMFTVIDGKVNGKAKTASTNGMYPEPTIIDKDDVPSKVLDKINKKLQSIK